MSTHTKYPWRNSLWSVSAGQSLIFLLATLAFMLIAYNFPASYCAPAQRPPPVWITGQFAVYTSEADGRASIYSLNIQTGERRRLTRQGAAATPAWSADGKQKGAIPDRRPERAKPSSNVVFERR